jgi:hypothetical protein
MSKLDNKDFEDLYKVYTESKHLNKDEEKEEQTSEEEDVVEEGMWDRIKARGAGVKDAAGSWTKGVGQAIKGQPSTEDPQAKYKSAKITSILNSHIAKIDHALSNFATDLVKLGLVDENTAEKIADRASSIIKANPHVANVIKKSR